MTISAVVSTNSNGTITLGRSLEYSMSVSRSLTTLRSFGGRIRNTKSTSFNIGFFAFRSAYFLYNAHVAADRLSALSNIDSKRRLVRVRIIRDVGSWFVSIGELVEI